MQMRYGFVILHYMAYDMTVKCVNTLLEIFTNYYIRIVIVDNFSSNATGKDLKNHYKRQNNITVLYNKENLGFARGNNVGYTYLRNHYDLDYIIVMNNDVLIRQLDFLEKIHDLYLRERYAVLGPDIYSPYGIRKHQNPFFLQASSKSTLQKNLKKYKIEQHVFFLYYAKNCIFNTIRRFSPVMRSYQYIKHIILQDNGGGYMRQHINPILHGACYVFSRDFIATRSYAFYPKTFLYYEENILYYQCMNAGLKLLYSPEVQVLHFEDVSTDMIFKKDYQKEKFKLENMIASLRIFLDLMEEEHDREKA